jgi:hypothetical protein
MTGLSPTSTFTVGAARRMGFGSLECPRGVRGFLFWREYVAMGR